MSSLTNRIELSDIQSMMCSPSDADDQSIDQSDDQSNDQSDDETDDQSINQPINQSNKQSDDEIDRKAALKPYQDVTYRVIKQRVKTLPKRTLFMSVFLFVVGLSFLTTGLSLSLTQGINTAVPFLSLGGLTIIPGAYHCAIIFAALFGIGGITVYSVPRYDRL